MEQVISPAWLDLRGVVFMLLELNPACSDWTGLAISAYPPRYIPRRRIVLRGSSSFMFSKYLLPYRSAPMKVPALVSPSSQASRSVNCMGNG